LKQQEQPQAVFAREFAAWTRALKGWLERINSGLIRILAAPLAFAPNGGVIFA
jgi:hypothetical protein